MALGWDDLWLRPDQQATRALQAGDMEQAAQLARDPALRGTAEYKAGNYDAALQAFAAQADVDADYNQGNALAQLQRYEEAIAAYERALEKQPQMEDALHNKAEIEKLLQQQQQQEQQQQQQQDQQQSESGDNADNQQSQQDQQQGESGENADQQQGQQNQNSGSDRQDARGDTDEQGSEGSQANAAGEEGDDSQQDSAAAADEQQQADAEDPADSQQQSADAQQAQDAGDDAQDVQSAEQQTAEAEENPNGQQATAAAEPLDSEEQRAAEQWLRRIPDDPGGLLRRKFLYQYNQRAGRAPADDQQAW
jgi:Ca-activated chloride channel family protein